MYLLQEYKRPNAYVDAGEPFLGAGAMDLGALD